MPIKANMNVSAGPALRAVAALENRVKTLYKVQADQVKITAEQSKEGFRLVANFDKLAKSGSVVRTRLTQMANAHGILAQKIASTNKVIIHSENEKNKVYQRSNAVFLKHVEDMVARRGREVAAYNKMVASQQRSSTVQNNIHNTQKSINSAVEEGTKKAKQFNLAFESMAKIVAIQLLHRQVSRIAQALSEGIETATKLQIAIAEIRTIDIGVSSIEQWQQAIVSISSKFGLDTLNVANAAYEALSNQIINTASEFTVFGEVAARFAITTQTTMDKSIDLISNTLNAYNKSFSEADNISAQFFKTIELGRIRGEELAENLGNIATIAKQVGVPLEELNAAIATLTIQGVGPAETMTQLRGILVKLLTPTKALKDLLFDVGVESGEAAIKTFGFGGFLKILQERTKGSAEELFELINRMRGITGAMAFTGHGFDLYMKSLQEIQNATTDYVKGTIIVMESAGKKYEIMRNKVKNYFIGMGSDILQFVSDATNGFQQIDKIVIFLAKSITYILIPAIVALGSKMAWLALATPFGKIAIGAGILIGVIDKIIKSTQESNKAYENFLNMQKDKIHEVELEKRKQLETSLETYKKYTNAENQIFNQRVAKEISALRERYTYNLKYYNSMKDYMKDVNDKIIDNLKQSTTSLKEVLKDTQNNIQEATKASKQIMDDLLKQEFDWKFEDAGENLEQRLKVITEGINTYLSRARVGIDPQTFIPDYKQAIQFMNQADSEILKSSQQLSKAKTSLDEEHIKKIADLEQQQIEKQQRYQEDLATKNIRTRSQQMGMIRQYREIQDIQTEIQTENQQYQKAKDALDKEQATINKQGKQREEIRKLYDEMNNRILQYREDQHKKELAYIQAEYAERMRLEKMMKLQKVISDFDIKKVFELENEADIKKAIQDHVDAMVEFEKTAKTQSEKDLAKDVAASRKNTISLANDMYEDWYKTKLKKQYNQEINDAQIYFDQLIKIYHDNSQILTSYKENLMALKSLKQFIPKRDFYKGSELSNIFNTNKKFDYIDYNGKRHFGTSTEEGLRELAPKLEDTIKELEKYDEISNNINATIEQITTQQGIALKAVQDLFFSVTFVKSDKSKIISNALTDIMGQLGGEIGGIGNLGILKRTTDILAKRIETLQQYNKETTEKTKTATELQFEIVKDIDTVIANSVERVKVIKDILTDIQNQNSKLIPDAVTEQVDRSLNIKQEYELIFQNYKLQKEYNDELERQNELYRELISFDFSKIFPEPQRFGPWVTQPKALGGIINYLARGGSPRGSDTVPAMLTPGEFVVNKAASERFYSQLLTMNRSTRPGYYSNGGNVDVGGINITVNGSNSPKMTAREVASELNRGIRRGYIKLRSN